MTAIVLYVAHHLVISKILDKRGITRKDKPFRWLLLGGLVIGFNRRVIRFFKSIYRIISGVIKWIYNLVLSFNGR